MQLYTGKSIPSCPRGDKSLGFNGFFKTCFYLPNPYKVSISGKLCTRCRGHNGGKMRHGPRLSDLTV